MDAAITIAMIVMGSLIVKLDRRRPEKPQVSARDEITGPDPFPVMKEIRRRRSLAAGTSLVAIGIVRLGAALL